MDFRVYICDSSFLFHSLLSLNQAKMLIWMFKIHFLFSLDTPAMPNRFSSVQFFATPWTVAFQVPLSKGFPRQEYWNALPFPSPGDLPNPGIESESPASVGNSLSLTHQGRPKHWLSQHYLANLYKSISPHSNSTHIPITGIIFNTHIPA